MHGPRPRQHDTMFDLGPVSIRYALYTLACHQFLDRQRDLTTITMGNPRVKNDDCIDAFNGAMLSFLHRYAPMTMEDAASTFNTQLLAYVDPFKGNTQIMALFQDVANAISERGDLWDAVEDTRVWHNVGRDLALAFYADSPLVQVADQIVCDLQHGYLECPAGCNASNMQRCSASGLGPLMAYQSVGARVRANFSLHHTFQDYVAFPFLFLHEYTSHVYGNDFLSSPCFNDGWMLYAAARFFQKAFVANQATQCCQAHIDIFFESLLPMLRGDFKDGAQFALDMDALLRRTTEDRFMWLTHQLALFAPRTLEPLSWPGEVIYLLMLAFKSEQLELLRNHIKDTPDIRVLPRNLLQGNRPVIEHLKTYRPGHVQLWRRLGWLI